MQRPLAVALTGGIAAGKSEALRAFERHGAAVISSDDVVHRLYREDEGLRAAIQVRRQWPAVGVLVLSQYVEERYATKLLTGDTSAGTRAQVRARGASGYVPKGSDPGVVLDAIRLVAVGHVWPEDGDAPAAVLSVRR